MSYCGLRDAIIEFMVDGTTRSNAEIQAALAPLVVHFTSEDSKRHNLNRALCSLVDRGVLEKPGYGFYRIAPGEWTFLTHEQREAKIERHREAVRRNWKRIRANGPRPNGPPSAIFRNEKTLDEVLSEFHSDGYASGVEAVA